MKGKEAGKPGQISKLSADREVSIKPNSRTLSYPWIAIDSGIQSLATPLMRAGGGKLILGLGSTTPPFVWQAVCLLFFDLDRIRTRACEGRAKESEAHSLG
jgi:hypothetical protein